MPIRIAVTKSVGHNEQMVFDIAQWNPVTGEIEHADTSEMCALLDQATKFADLRALELHTQMLEGYELRKYCTPAEWTKILDVLEVVTGKQRIESVAVRWQSSVEETNDLEAARLEAFREHGMHAIDMAALEEAERTGDIYDGKEY